MIIVGYLTQIKKQQNKATTFAALELLAGLVGEMAAANLEVLIKESDIIQLLVQKMQESSP